MLAAAGLDATTHTLFLAPTMRKTEPRVLLPLYFPSFWATVEAVRATAESAARGGRGRGRATTGGTITFKIVKQFGPATMILKQVTTQPIGVASANGTTFVLPRPFECTVNAHSEHHPLNSSMPSSALCCQATLATRRDRQHADVSCAQEGATLDLSAHWVALVDASVIRDRVLPPNPPRLTREPHV